MPNLYATFKDPEMALLFAKELRESGYLMDDISVLVHETYAKTHPTSPQHKVPTLEDATAFVGREDDPEGVRPVIRRHAEIREDLFHESRVGGGIATDMPDDDISAIEESDDASDIADDETSSSRTEEVREALDFGHFVLTGFPIQIPKIDDFHETPGPSENLDDLLEAIPVPCFGVAMGGSGLATAALGQQCGMRGHKPVLDYLRDEGVDIVDAMDLIKTFAEGGAAVEVSIGSGNIAELEEFANRLGAGATFTTALPPY